jgi:hypothetical protein
MSVLNLLNIYALDYAVESTFGVAPADSPDGYRRLKILDRPVISLAPETLAEAVRSYRLTRTPAHRGALGGTFRFTCLLRGGGVAATDTTGCGEAELGPLLLLSGMKAVAPTPAPRTSAIGTAGTATAAGAPLTVYEGTGARMAAGQGVATPWGVVTVRDVADNSVVLSRGPTAAPSLSQPQVLVGGRCYTPVSAPGELVHLPTATLRFTTPEATLTLTGCAFTFTLRGDAKGLITVEFSGPFDGYAVSEPVQPADPPMGSPWPVAGLKALGAPLSYDNTTTPCAGFTFTLGSRIEPMADLGAPNGRAGFYIADRDGQALTATLYYSRAYFSHARSMDPRPVELNIPGASAANLPGSGHWANLFIPAADVSVETVTAGGVEAVTLTAVPVDPGAAPALGGTALYAGDVFITLG